MSEPFKRADLALLLAAHGERQVEDPNRALLAHADELAGYTGYRCVAACVLNGEPTLEEAMETITRSGSRLLFVFPFFMASGYFVKDVLPKRLAEANADIETRILTPLGLDAGLAHSMLESALATAKRAEFDARKSHLLVVGHGSRSSSASADATRKTAEKLKNIGGFGAVSSAFLEEPPFVTDALRELEGPVVVSGYFAGNGMHSSRDVPEAIEESGANAVYTGPIGTDQTMLELVVSTCERVLVRYQE